MATTVTLKPNAIDISGSTSGTTTLQATAVAGTTTITLPAATDTLVGKATTDTLTNKTLTTPTINQFSSASATNLTIQSAGTTAVTIDTSQNVGISVTPSAWKSTLKALQIGGYTSLFNQPSNTDLGCNLYINSSGQAIYLNSDSATLYEMSGGVHAWYRASSGTAGNVATLNESMRIDSSGNVGIGTTSPSAPLTVVSNSSAVGLATRGRSSDNLAGTYYFSNNGATTYGTILASATEFRFTSTPAAAVQTFYTNAAERMRIDSNGKILFNTTTQNSNEQVGMVYSSNSGVGFSIQDSNAQNGNTFIQFRNGATVAGTITSNGTTTMTYGSASDYRLKSNPQPIQNALAKVSALNPVSFTWNQTGEEGIGFIAHELQAVCPDAVVGEKDKVDAEGNPEYQMIDTGSASLIATLTAAIQELKAINDQQAETINALTARVVALESK